MRTPSLTHMLMGLVETASEVCLDQMAILRTKLRVDGPLLYLRGYKIKNSAVILAWQRMVAQAVLAVSLARTGAAGLLVNYGYRKGLKDGQAMEPSKPKPVPGQAVGSLRKPDLIQEAVDAGVPETEVNQLKVEQLRDLIRMIRRSQSGEIQPPREDRPKVSRLKQAELQAMCRQKGLSDLGTCTEMRRRLLGINLESLVPVPRGFSVSDTESEIPTENSYEVDEAVLTISQDWMWAPSPQLPPAPGYPPPMPGAQSSGSSSMAPGSVESDSTYALFGSPLSPLEPHEIQDGRSKQGRKM